MRGLQNKTNICQAQEYTSVVLLQGRRGDWKTRCSPCEWCSRWCCRYSLLILLLAAATCLSRLGTYWELADGGSCHGQATERVRQRNMQKTKIWVILEQPHKNCSLYFFSPVLEKLKKYCNHFLAPSTSLKVAGRELPSQGIEYNRPVVNMENLPVRWDAEGFKKAKLNQTKTPEGQQKPTDSKIKRFKTFGTNQRAEFQPSLQILCCNCSTLQKRFSKRLVRI